MEELRKQFEKICFSTKRAQARDWDQEKMIDELLQAVRDYFKQTGKQGGETTKKKTDYVALGKKGAAKRWGK